MRDSVRLGKISGISIGLHWSIALIAGLFTITLAGTILPGVAAGYTAGAYLIVAAAVAVAFLASIVAHELGHSLVAQRNDVGVSGITLFALGGVAKLENEPSNPGAAARIALAGPAVSVAIGVGSLVVGQVVAALGFPTLVVAGITWLGVINLAMAGLFWVVDALPPALPLDGGRALQAALWKRNGDPHQATISAATLGRYIGAALIAFGIWQFLAGAGGIWTALIGWFILASAKAEAFRAQVEIQRRSWNPTEWMGWAYGGPQPPPPRPETRVGGPEVIDVDGRRVG